MEIENLFFDQGLSQYSLDFIEISKIKMHSNIELGSRISNIMNNPFYAKQVINHTTELGNTKKIKLPKSDLNNNAFKEILKSRKSSTLQTFKNFINLNELSNVLTNSYFVIGEKKVEYGLFRKRSIPSGGAMYPIELFYINLNTIGLEKGIFYYNPIDENLEEYKTFKQEDALFKGIENIFPYYTIDNVNIKSISGVIVFVGILNRVSSKYSDRGLRFALIDVGSILQNIYLNVAINNLLCCAIGGYIDDSINNFLDLSYPNETCLLTLFLGK